MHDIAQYISPCAECFAERGLYGERARCTKVSTWSWGNELKLSLTVSGSCYGNATIKNPADVIHVLSRKASRCAVLRI